MKIGETIQYKPIDKQLTMMLSNTYSDASIVDDYILCDSSSIMLDTIICELVKSKEKRLVFLDGPNGTGKTHTLLLLSRIISSNPITRTRFFNKNLSKVFELDNPFKTILIDLHYETAPLEEIILASFQTAISSDRKTDIIYSTNPISDTTNKQNLFQMLNQETDVNFLFAFDNLSEYFENRNKADVQEQCEFLEKLQENQKNSNNLYIFSIDGKEMQYSKKTSSYFKSLSQKSEYLMVKISEDIVENIIYTRCLQKTGVQFSLIRKYLSSFFRFFPKMDSYFEKYIHFFPLHPDLIKVLMSSRLPKDYSILNSLSELIAQHNTDIISQVIPLFFSYDSIWSGSIRGKIGKSSEQFYKQALQKDKSIKKQIKESEMSQEDKRIAYRAVDALLYLYLTNFSNETVGLSAEGFRDYLCLWHEMPENANAQTLLEEINRILNRVVTICNHRIIDYDSKTKKYCLSSPQGENYNQKITLEQIAELINVSRTTLYKVINNKGNVKESTREKIEKALIEYNYIPNFNARDLAHHRAYEIAYIGMEHHGSTYFAPLVNLGIQRAINEYGDNGLNIISAISKVTEPENQIKDIEEMLSRGIKNFVIVPCNPKVIEKEIKKLRKLNCNIVFLSRYVQEKNKVFVGIDYPKSGRLAAEMMSKIMPEGGNIVITTSDKLEDDLWVEQRYSGFVEYIKQFGDKYRILALKETLISNEIAKDEVRSIIDEYPELDAFYDISYKSDIIASVLEERKIEERVKLIGFDVYDEVVPYVQRSSIDIIIGQSLSKQAYEAFRMLFNYLCYGVPLKSGDYNYKLDVIVANNIDCV